MRASLLRCFTISALSLAIGCGEPDDDTADGGNDAAQPTCESPPELELGDPDGHADPLGAGPAEARAGRVAGDALPPFPSGLGTWDEGGFLLANDRVAMVIEDVGPSHLYDPWGGRPLGIARVEEGALVDVGDFGEILILTGRYTVMTTSVTVLADGSDGGAAIVRASGPLRALPFFEAITSGPLSTEFEGVDAAIDYVLEPGSSHVDVRITYASSLARPISSITTMHGFMYTPRMPAFAPGPGFSPQSLAVDAISYTDERGVGFVYEVRGEELGVGINASGFESRFTRRRPIAECGLTTVEHARLTIAGPGVDAMQVAHADENDVAMRAIEGVVRDASGTPAAGVRVHVRASEERYLTRSLPTGDDGRYMVHVPASEGALELFAYRQGDALVGPVSIDAATTTRDLALGAGGWVRVTVTDEGGGALPSRIQVLPLDGASVPSVPSAFGEALPTSGRVQVALSEDGTETLRVPAGRWRVAMSRGYEYELETRDVEVTSDGQTIDVSAQLERVIETPGVQCADFHIHTRRSNDSADDVLYKLRGAIADGLEIPVRSDHEFAADFTAEVSALSAEEWAYGGVGSVEMSSMELWGHMGVVPLTPDPTRINMGAPLWQEWPTPEQPDLPLRTMSPVEVFDAARARPERPTVIINHPLGDTNYFGYVGYDPITGTVEREADWDDEFTAVEFFNDADWGRERGRLVVHWLSFLDRGRRVFAVGSSDSHGLDTSPVGYPRTCMQLGTDVPGELSPNGVRDAVAQGRSTISGGIYVDAAIGDAGPGADVVAGGARATVHVRVQAASWVDVDAIEIVVDGRTLDTIEILPADAPDPVARPHVRFERDVEFDVAEGRGSYVIVAAYGDAALEPVHRGRTPFGVTNPIFVTR
ncbi:CehA/McbA family metallohydrolase [Sandaracinus amylolyticus]|uniref:CehA/McbA family metallohydrolase n=1 Tax=Sandaracinus amylolyticus TaxID=927083 RepID=UPI001F274D85|nr:CehA/McbA family metallohydrolase [Sandaracinus amylolyticus]UJR86776.1 Hypothetical protein I5071_88770 [Sandaracinus amylolyticus]